MHIVLLCATRRGLRFLERLLDIAPDAKVTVFSFREEPWEPPFLDDIRALAEARGPNFHEARQVGSGRWNALWESTDVDLLFAVSWRYMVPRHVYGRARLGSFVFHDSLLPAYRGFSPTVWAMVNGEDNTGVTLFEMIEDVDAGDIVDQERVPITAEDTIANVLERTTDAYLRVLSRALPALVAGNASRTPQDHSRATYTCKRMPEDNEIDWSAPTARVYDLIRACTAPYSGAYTRLEGRRLRVWAARPVTSCRTYVGRVPGRVAEVHPGKGTVVLTVDGALLLARVQLDDGPIVDAAEVLTGLGQTLGRTPDRA